MNGFRGELNLVKGKATARASRIIITEKKGVGSLHPNVFYSFKGFCISVIVQKKKAKYLKKSKI